MKRLKPQLDEVDRENFVKGLSRFRVLLVQNAEAEEKARLAYTESIKRSRATANNLLKFIDGFLEPIPLVDYANGQKQ